MRNKRRAAAFPLLCAALLLTVAPEVQAGYGTLLREMAEYQPPPVVAASLTAQPVSPAPAPVPGEEEFQAQVAALRQRQGEWLKALNAPQPEASFLTPDPALLATLRSAAKDDDAAAKALTGPFSLQTLETLVLLRSSAVKARESELKAVLEGYSQAEALDTILRRYASLTKSVMPVVGGMSNPDPLPFKFPFPGVLALKGEVVGQEAQAAGEALEAARREAVTAARRDYAELLFSHQALTLTRSQLQLLDNLHGAVSARYEAGTGGFQELTAIASEREKVREELATRGEERKNSEAAIRAALLLPESVVLGVPAPAETVRSAAPLDKLYAVATERRQEIRAQRAMVGRMERMLELAETMVYPGFSQGLTLFEGDAVSRVTGEGLQPGESGEGGMVAGSEGSFPATVAASSGAGLPKMPWFGSDDAYLRQTRQRIHSLKQELAAISSTTLLGVRKAWFLVDKASREATLYRERVIPLAKAALDSASQGYAAGRVDFAGLIESATAWLKANLALARAEADLEVAQAELDAAVGVSGAGSTLHP